VRKPETKRPLGRPRRWWENNIKIDLKRNRVGLYELDSFGSGYEPVTGLLNTVMDLRVP
jgi:hypothetical protein